MEQLTINLFYTEVDGVRVHDTEEMIRQLHLKIAAVEKRRSFSCNKFIVVDTWNGDDMESNNGSVAKIMFSEGGAREYAQELAEEEAIVAGEGYATIIEYKENKDALDTKLHSYGYDYDDNHGTYQVHELHDDIYAVKITCNINEVELLTKEEYDNDPDNDGSDFVDDGQFYIKFVVLGDDQKPQ